MFKLFPPFFLFTGIAFTFSTGTSYLVPSLPRNYSIYCSFGGGREQGMMYP